MDAARGDTRVRPVAGCGGYAFRLGAGEGGGGVFRSLPPAREGGLGGEAVLVGPVAGDHHWDALRLVQAGRDEALPGGVHL